MTKPTLVRITTVPLSLEKLLTGQLHFMSSFYNVIAVSSDKERLKKYGELEKVAVFPLDMTRQITPLQDILSVIKLFFFLKKTKPFIVHTHTPKAGIVGMLASRLAGVPNRLHTVAGMPLLEQTGFKRIILDFVEKLTYSCATKVYPNSFKMKDIIIQNKYCLADKLKVLANGSSNGIDTSYFDASHFSEEFKENLKKELGLLPTDFVFVFVGRIVSDKGINELILAFAAIQKQVKEVKLILVGPYEQELDPLKEVTKHQIKTNKSIISVGYQLDVRPYFAISDGLVFPSYREGFPNVVMQSGAMGLPCIVTDINGCNEIIEHAKNGFVIPVKNQKAIQESMLHFIKSREQFIQMQQNARAIIVSRFDQQFMWESILQEYRSFESKNKWMMYKRYFKRILDFFISIIGLLVLLPLLLVISIFLFFANSGSPFFFQNRPGKDGVVFKIVKFKTMNDKKDKNGNLCSDEIRLTKIGGFIRKTSLDELPQLINVAKGDMSLIGPRPLLIDYLQLYSDHQKRRHEVKPGITGWAQVNGRNTISWSEKFDYDVWYVENCTFILDCRIVILTIKKVFMSEGISAVGSMTTDKFKGN